jgi:hypothetical protein
MAIASMIRMFFENMIVDNFWIVSFSSSAETSCNFPNKVTCCLDKQGRIILIDILHLFYLGTEGLFLVRWENGDSTDLKFV